jgi:hypothetical protein
MLKVVQQCLEISISRKEFFFTQGLIWLLTYHTKIKKINQEEDMMAAIIFNSLFNPTFHTQKIVCEDAALIKLSS